MLSYFTGLGPAGMENTMNSVSTTLICLACYKDRLASVCENADEYLLFEIRDDKIYPAGRLSLPSKDPMDRTSAILACGVTFLLCGAICALTRTILEKNGINVIPWLTGPTDAILHAFKTDSLFSFRMPGCRMHGSKSKGTGQIRRQRRGQRHENQRQLPLPNSTI